MSGSQSPKALKVDQHHRMQPPPPDLDRALQSESDGRFTSLPQSPHNNPTLTVSPSQVAFEGMKDYQYSYPHTNREGFRVGPISPARHDEGAPVSSLRPSLEDLPKARPSSLGSKGR